MVYSDAGQKGTVGTTMSANTITTNFESELTLLVHKLSWTGNTVIMWGKGSPLAGLRNI